MDRRDRPTCLTVDQKFLTTLRKTGQARRTDRSREGNVLSLHGHGILLPECEVHESRFKRSAARARRAP